MPCQLSLADGQKVSLDLPSDATVLSIETSEGIPPESIGAAVAEALAQPLDFPCIRRSTVPGDHIAVALERGVPQVAMVLAGIVETILEEAPEVGRISIVVAESARPEEETWGAGLLDELPGTARERVELVVHRPRDQEGLAFLAMSSRDEPLYFNRCLCDADIVLPVSAQRCWQPEIGLNQQTALFPSFADQRTIERFQALEGEDDADAERRVEAADEAAWLLGVQFAIRVLPGPGDSVLRVLAGDASSVDREARVLADGTWKRRAPAPAELVVATLEGGAEQQTWDNLARVLFNALRAVEDGGAIVLCTQLREAPGPAVLRLSDLVDETDWLPDELPRDGSTDAIAARLLWTARQQARLFLMSGLERDLVEDLGLGHVVDTREIERLSRAFSSVLLLSSAQHLQLT